MADIQPDDAETGFDDATEETGLLQSNGHAPSHDSGWAGDDDFAGLPWWKRPSVCHSAQSLRGWEGSSCGIQILTLDFAGLVPACSVCAVYPRIWRLHCPEAESVGSLYQPNSETLILTLLELLTWSANTTLPTARPQTRTSPSLP
jgi:hypothetical protein